MEEVDTGKTVPHMVLSGVLLHGFIKQTQKTPDDDIALAQKRWKEWQDAEEQ